MARASSDQFIGRARELAELRAAWDGGARLVTVLGAGGLGKTRLVREYLADEARGCFADLSHATTLEAVVASVATALRVPLTGGGDGVDQISGALADAGDLLLVLDNAEQVVGDLAACVSTWRASADAARFLVTSRRPLQLAGEQRMELAPLDSRAARELFDARARAIAADFAPGAAEDAALATLLARLEGFPLAIELAAARVNLLGVTELGARLAESFALLSARRRDVPERQLTLASTIQWSCDLLTPAEREALEQCGVFRGGFTLAGAEAVVRVSSPAAPAPVVDLLHELIEHSLVVRVRSHDGDAAAPRYALYESIRQFAATRLAEHGNHHAAAARHAAHYLEVTRPFQDLRAAYGGVGAAALAAIIGDTDNAFAAIEWARERDPGTAARIGLALANLTFLRGPALGNLAVLADALACAERAGDDEILCRLLIARAGSVRQWGRGGEVGAELARARQLAARLGARDLEGLAVHYLAKTAADESRFSEAGELFEAALVLHQQAGDNLGLGLTYEAYALLSGWLGNAARRAELHGLAIAASRRAGNPRWEAVSLRNRAAVLQERGELEQAIADTERAMALQRPLGDAHLAGTLCNLGDFSAQRGDSERAARLLDEAIAGARAGLYPPRFGDPYHPRGWLHLIAGELEQAERILDEGIDRFGGPIPDGLGLQILICRGAVRLLRGRRREAHSDLAEVVAWARAHPAVRTDAPFAAALLAAAEQGAGHPERAWPAFAWAEAQAVRWSRPQILRWIARVRPLLTGDSTPPALRLGDQLADGSHPYVEEVGTSVVVQALQRGIAAPIATTARVRIDAACHWFEASSGARVDLLRRPMMQRLVGALLAALRAHPGQPLSRDELLAAVWPEDRSHLSSLENRLWVAMSTLRGLGLGDVLLRSESGYWLAPAQVEVISL